MSKIKVGMATEEKLGRKEHSRLAEECAKLNPQFESAMAEEGLNEIVG